MEYLRKKVNSHLHANFPQGCRLLSLSTLFRSRSHCNAQLKKSEMGRRKNQFYHETKILSSCSRFARKRIKCPKEENFSSRKKEWLSTRLERISFDRLELAAEISLKPNNFTIFSDLLSETFTRIFDHASNKETLLSLEIFISSFRSTSLLVQFRNTPILDFVSRGRRSGYYFSASTSNFSKRDVSVLKKEEISRNRFVLSFVRILCPPLDESKKTSSVSRKERETGE